jgi:hypothetical protein
LAEQNRVFAKVLHFLSTLTIRQSASLNGVLENRWRA